MRIEENTIPVHEQDASHGISESIMEAEEVFEELGCRSYSIDLSIGCIHNCLYCHFSKAQKIKYRRYFRSYRGESIVLSIDKRFPDQKINLGV